LGSSWVRNKPRIVQLKCLGFIKRAGNDPRDVESEANLDNQSAAWRRHARRYSIISGEYCRPDEVIK
jgi:hypothetical protein